MQLHRKITVVGLAVLAVIGTTASAYATDAADPLNGPAAGAATPAPDRSNGLEAKKKDARFAVVEADGTLARGKNAESAAQIDALGAYEVFFDRDVSECAYNATIGSSSTGTAVPGIVVVAARNGEPTAVFVDTSNLDRSDGDRPFHLVVVC